LEFSSAFGKPFHFVDIGERCRVSANSSMAIDALEYGKNIDKYDHLVATDVMSPGGFFIRSRY
jgi:hypothetical protein